MRRTLSLVLLCGVLQLTGCGGSSAGLSDEQATAEIKKLGGKITLSPDKKITGVDLTSKDVGDAGLAHLKGLANLQTLDLGQNSGITDAGLEHLKGLTQLRDLDLAETKITDAGLATLAGLTQLQVLTLNKTGITNAGLAHLKGMTQLTKLRLNDTEIGDPALEHLKGLKLKELFIQDAKFTDEGFDELKKTFPNAQIPR